MHTWQISTFSRSGFVESRPSRFTAAGTMGPFSLPHFWQTGGTSITALLPLFSSALMPLASACAGPMPSVLRINRLASPTRRTARGYWQGQYIFPEMHDHLWGITSSCLSIPWPQIQICFFMGAFSSLYSTSSTAFASIPITPRTDGISSGLCI